LSGRGEVQLLSGEPVKSRADPRSMGSADFMWSSQPAALRRQVASSMRSDDSERKRVALAALKGHCETFKSGAGPSSGGVEAARKVGAAVESCHRPAASTVRAFSLRARCRENRSMCRSRCSQTGSPRGTQAGWNGRSATGFSPSYVLWREHPEAE
jgi:hypothetical protein